MQLELKQGVYSTATSLLGGGIVILAPNAQALGWILIGAGVGLLIWGVRINSKHLWQRWWRKEPTDLAKLAMPVAPRKERVSGHPGSKSSLWSPTLERMIADMELQKRIAWANHMPPMKTDYPLVHAEAKAIIRELTGRLGYVDDALEGRKPLQDWRGKIAQQRVGYEALDKSPLASLTDKEREQARIAVRELADLDRHVNEVLAQPRKHPANRVAGMYKHRAEKARDALQELVEIMEQEDEG